LYNIFFSNLMKLIVLFYRAYGTHICIVALLFPPWRPGLFILNPFGILITTKIPLPPPFPASQLPLPPRFPATMLPRLHASMPPRLPASIPSTFNPFVFFYLFLY
jgi:hypothetical protein